MRRILMVLFLILAGASSAPAAEKWRGTGVPTLTPAIQTRLATLKHLYGPRLGPSSFRGKVVVVTFFASWCPPCHVEFKHLKTIEKAHRGRGLVIVAVNWWEEWEGMGGGEKLRIFLDRYAPPFTIVKGDKATSKAFGNVERIPTLMVFGRDGRNAFHFIHRYKARKTHVTLEELKAAIVPLLRAPAPR